jgi:predicted nuclease of predicted toxin-antitoxin system
MAWRRELPLSDEEVSRILHEQRRRSRFLVDESLGAEVTRLLRRLRWNVKDVYELGLAGHPDENVLAAAKADDRILLTHDRGFLDERRFPHHRNPGVAILPGAQGNEGALLRALAQMLAVVGRARDLYRATRIIIRLGGRARWSPRSPANACAPISKASAAE